jgi:hypothetical protein
MNPVGGKIFRASRRLEIARRLMRMEEGDDVLGRIKSLPAEKRDHLRDLVDWIEEYENYEL